MKTRKCDNCDKEYDYDPDLIVNVDGLKMTQQSQMDLYADNQSVWFICDDCVVNMPDASHFFESGNVYCKPNPNKLN